MKNISLKFLKKISESLYELDGNFSLCRLITDENGIIDVDLEGGPMISVGDQIDGRVISQIISEDDRIIITLENV